MSKAGSCATIGTRDKYALVDLTRCKLRRPGFNKHVIRTDGSNLTASVPHILPMRCTSYRFAAARHVTSALDERPSPDRCIWILDIDVDPCDARPAAVPGSTPGLPPRIDTLVQLSPSCGATEPGPSVGPPPQASRKSQLRTGPRVRVLTGHRHPSRPGRQGRLGLS